MIDVLGKVFYKCYSYVRLLNMLCYWSDCRCFVFCFILLYKKILILDIMFEFLYFK